MREKIGALMGFVSKEPWESRSTATIIPSASTDLPKVLLWVSGQADQNAGVKLDVTRKSQQCVRAKRKQKARDRGLSLAMTFVTHLWAARGGLHQLLGPVNEWLLSPS